MKFRTGFNRLLTGILFLGVLNSCNGTSGNDPCVSPVSFTLGHIDERFGIDRAILTGLIVEAAEVWNEAAGWEVARYDSKGRIPVHFIYGELQLDVEKDREISRIIEEAQGWIIELERAVSWAQRDYEDRLRQYQVVNQNYESRLRSFNQLVADYNARGGASEQQMSQLMEERSRLERVRIEIDGLYREVEALRLKANRLTTELNDQITQNNRRIIEYNRQFNDGRTFHIGSYEQVGTEGVITIYQFISYNRLRVILAHEIGHALGLDHGTDPESVMFSHLKDQFTGQFRLSDEDIALIRTQCWSETD